MFCLLGTIIRMSQKAKRFVYSEQLEECLKKLKVCLLGKIIRVSQKAKSFVFSEQL